ncbi:MAG: hypothetical protein II863_17545 [Kiritimatiellae bacterium]|nr:hypothetical protein [Kiritimatiellia bacterium]
MNAHVKVLTATACIWLAAFAAADDLPLYSIRFASEQTRTNVWPQTMEVFRRHPRVMDEVWFSTGVCYPAMDWHLRNAAEQTAAAADMRRLGVTPSLQVQVTLGHGIVKGSQEQWAGKTWTGFVGHDGGECAYSACPTDGRFIDYIVESTALYAAYKPAWVWIDDDFRMIGHGPEAPWRYNQDLRDYGCWCDRCLEMFKRCEGLSCTRAELYEKMGADAALADRWDAFSFSSLANVAERIAARFHELSPGTRFGLQHCPHLTSRQSLIFKALYRATGNQGVGSRPGGGWYQDHSFYGQILKAYFEVRQKNIIGNIPEITLYTPEIETYPRVFTSRSGRSMLIEALAALSMGMDTLSLYFFDCRPPNCESIAFYERRFVEPLSRAAPMLRNFRRLTAGTRPSGLASEKPFSNFTGFERDVPTGMQITVGIPIVMDPEHALGRIDLDTLSAWASSSTRLISDYARADALSGGRLAAIPTEPMQGWLLPRTTEDGALKTVTFVNTTLDSSWPTRLKLRGVSADMTAATWYGLDGTIESCPVAHDGSEAFVTIPEVAPWDGGYLGFE